MIPVVVAGANGKMGREAVRAILQQVDLKLVAALGHTRGLGEDVGVLSGLEPTGVLLEDKPEEAIIKGAGGILIDLSLGEVIEDHVLLALKYKMSCVVGATAIPPQTEQRIAAAATENGVLIVPNFALGAVLMMRFSQVASQYFRWAEIIEYHHERKLDAPSGTARRTAELMRKSRSDGFRTPVESNETLKGSRGGSLGGLRIHSVRLPGKLAHQEVLFSGPGETLTIKHDSLARESYMPGMLLAVREVQNMIGLTIGLENLIQ